MKPSAALLFISCVAGFARDQPPAMMGRSSGVAARGGEPPAAADVDSGLPDLFSALEKQLGLRLVKAKEVPLDVIVIDHLEKIPTEN